MMAVPLTVKQVIEEVPGAGNQTKGTEERHSLGNYAGQQRQAGQKGGKNSIRFFSHWVGRNMVR